MLKIIIRPMKASDLAEIIMLVKQTEGLAFKDWENEQVLKRALKRNKNLSQVAVFNGSIVGAVLIGEGIMTMVHHLAVDPRVRNSHYNPAQAQKGAPLNVGTRLVQAGLRSLFQTKNGSRRVYVTVLKENLVAQAFWKKFGCTRQAEGNLVLFTLDLADQAWLQTSKN